MITITPKNYPKLYRAINAMCIDGGSPCALEKYTFDENKHEFLLNVASLLKTIEGALASLTDDELDELSCGETTDMIKISRRSAAHALASIALGLFWQAIP